MLCGLILAVPEKIEFHTIPGAGHALNYMTDPAGCRKIVRAFTEKHLTKTDRTR